MNPTSDPSMNPSMDPVVDPTIYPTIDPTLTPTLTPTTDPTPKTTIQKTTRPSMSPTTSIPTSTPSLNPTNSQPSFAPTTDPTAKYTTGKGPSEDKPEVSVLLHFGGLSSENFASKSGAIKGFLSEESKVPESDIHLTFLSSKGARRLLVSSNIQAILITSEPQTVKESLSNLEKMEKTLQKYDDELTLLSASEITITMPEDETAVVEDRDKSSSKVVLIILIMVAVLIFLGLCFMYYKKNVEHNVILDNIWKEKRLPGAHTNGVDKRQLQSDYEDSFVLDKRFMLTLDTLQGPPDTPLSQDGSLQSIWTTPKFTKNRLKQLGEKSALSDEESISMYTPRDATPKTPVKRIW